MTSTTWTTAAPAITPRADIITPALPALKKLGHFMAVFIGVYAEQDSTYRGLDLNGNAVWAKKNTQ